MQIVQSMSKLWMPKAAFEKMKQLANEKFPYETGGMLLGYSADNGEVVVQNLIGAGLAAKHGAHNFEPDPIYQQTLLEQYFFNSGGQTTYLGDWHTHPNGTTRLSSTDKRTLANIACTPASKNANPVMSVLAGDEMRWELQAVQFNGLESRWFFRKYNLLPLTINIYL